MQETFDSFQTSDGLKIHTVAWLPDSTPKAVVLVVHGIAEHSGRYRHVGEFLANRGYAVYALDHRGHGKSEGVRVYFDSFDQLAGDLERYFERVRTAHPALPMYILGHSMGSLITLLFTLRHQGELAGMISSGTPISLDQSLPVPLIALSGFVRNLAPKLALIALDVKAISTDPAVVAAQKADPLCYHGLMPIGTITAMVETGRKVREQVNTLRLPLLILHGQADKLTPPPGSQFIMDKAGSPDKTLKFYPGMYHEIVNEVDKATVLNDIATWLDSHTR